jgi:DMSO/TMAO reductase YedYZ molybdopterin-dependent catalytic subunit
MPRTPHIERHFTGTATVRDIVIGMADGLTVPFALAAGLSGAVDTTRSIVTAGLAEIAAGSIAMGLGGYLAAKSDAEHYDAERQREVTEVTEKPEAEVTETAAVFRSYGVTEDDSRPIVDALRQRPEAWVDSFLLGRTSSQRRRPRRSLRQWRSRSLQVYGLVENPVELSLDTLRVMGKKTQITLHHCIQGWSGIAAWGGLPLAELIKLVRPTPKAKAVVFYSFGEGAEGGQFYDSLSIENAMHLQTLLAYEMNDEPLTHLHGAPLRLRVQNQLGFKMVKWIQAIAFVESVTSINQGEGGYNEDTEYFGELADI